MPHHLLFQTESANPASKQSHALSPHDLLVAINQEDARIAAAVAQAIPQIERFVTAAAQQLRRGGHLIYLGAGTSGRLGVLDASECPPTYGVADNMVQGIMAGGDHALRHSIEGAEDDAQAGRQAVAHMNGHDVLLCLSASGSAAFVQGAAMEAKARGIYTGAVCTAPDSPLFAMVDCPILAYVGPEFVAGSTRMKSGTAQKMILNMISTTAMILLGKVYAGRMIDVKISNKKLVQRAIRMVETLSGCPAEQAEKTVTSIAEKTMTPVKPALVMILKNLSYDDALDYLQQHDNRIDVLMRETGRDKVLAS